MGKAEELVTNTLRNAASENVGRGNGLERIWSLNIETFLTQAQ
jgi:hypothetical protein